MCRPCPGVKFMLCGCYFTPSIRPQHLLGGVWGGRLVRLRYPGEAWGGVVQSALFAGGGPGKEVQEGKWGGAHGEVTKVKAHRDRGYRSGVQGK